MYKVGRTVLTRTKVMPNSQKNTWKGPTLGRGSNTPAPRQPTLPPQKSAMSGDIQALHRVPKVEPSSCAMTYRMALSQGICGGRRGGGGGKETPRIRWLGEETSLLSHGETCSCEGYRRKRSKRAREAEDK